MTDHPYTADQPEALPATPTCANCAELRKLLSAMRHRVVEVEREYVLLQQKVAEQAGAPPKIEVISDLPV